MRIALNLLSVIGLVGSVAAQEPGRHYDVNMVPGLVRLLEADANFANLVVGSSEVISVVPIGQNRVSIAAKRPGFSSIMFVDELGKLVASAEVTVNDPERQSGSLVTVNAHNLDNEDRVQLEYFCGFRRGCPAASTNEKRDAGLSMIAKPPLPGSTTASGGTPTK